MASPFSLKWLHHHLPLYYKKAPHTGVCSTHSLLSTHQINYKHTTQSSSYRASPTMALNDTKITIDGVTAGPEEEQFDYTQRAQWLRAAVLGANDGLLSTASIMMGVGAVKDDPKAMILSGFAGLVGGACSMAIGEFVSVYSQYDIELAQLKRGAASNDQQQESGGRKGLPNPLQAAVASALAFSVGAMVPLLAAGFISSYEVRLGVVFTAVTVALMVFGGVGAVLGRAPVGRSCGRVVVGGWMAMAVTFGLMKLFGARGL